MNISVLLSSDASIIPEGHAGLWASCPCVSSGWLFYRCHSDRSPAGSKAGHQSTSVGCISPLISPPLDFCGPLRLKAPTGASSFNF
jgi:hypothetical protein